MPNRILKPDELRSANDVLADVRKRLGDLSGDDRDLLFAYRRKVYKELMHDERGKPMARRKLKLLKHDEQRGLCAICSEQLPIRYSELDRRNAADGYTQENTRLVHGDCHRKDQAARGYG